MRELPVPPGWEGSSEAEALVGNEQSLGLSGGISEQLRAIDAL